MIVTKNSDYFLLQGIHGLVYNRRGHLDELREPQPGRQLRQQPALIRVKFDPIALSLTSALDAVWWSKSHPARFTPGKETRDPLYRKMRGSQGRTGPVRRISPPLVLDPRTVQPLASCCIDGAIPAHMRS
jgi:hypothetical protein